MKNFFINNKLKQFVLILLILILCIPQVHADMFSPFVSVRFQSTIDGGIPSVPVSVRFQSTIDGDIPSKPVSVRFQNTIPGNVWSGNVSFAFKNPVGMWSMDNNWQDSSGNGNHGAAFGNPVFDPNGKSNSAGSFNGTSAYIDAGSSSTLRPNYAVSVETWIKITALNAGSMFIAGNIDETSMTGYGLVVDSTGVAQFKLGNGSWSTVNSSTPLLTDVWYHIAGTYDGSKLRLYINGILNNESSASTIITYKNSFRIGYRPGTSGAGYFNGLIDELIVYSRPISAAEVDAHYKASKIDVIPPAAPTVNPVASPTATALVTLSGTKEADSSIWVNSTKIVNLDASTTWQGTYTLKSGANTLNVTSMDASDNQSAPTVVTVVLDDKPPVIESSIPVNNSDTTKEINNVTINLADEYSAINLEGSIENAVVRNSKGQLIAGTWTTSSPNTIIFTPTVPFPAEAYTVTIYPIDILGNRGEQQIVFTNYDITPPVTTVSFSGTLGNDGWYSTSVAVTMTAVDGNDGSGVDKIEYSFDGIIWNVYSAPFTVDNDGATTLYYRAIDKAGNIEKSLAKKNVSLAANSGTAYATSQLKDNNVAYDGSPSYCIDGQAVQASGSYGDKSTWLGANSNGDTFMVRFNGLKLINKMQWMSWTLGSWSNPQSQPKDYYVEYTTDPAPYVSGGNWQPIPNVVVTNTNGSVDQATAYIIGNTNGNWLYDTNHNWIIHEFTPVNATALRIRIASKVAGTAYGPALGEVEVYESAEIKSQDIKINKTGIVGQWHMDNDWVDTSVMANHGKAYGGATFSTDAKIGTNAGSFDGVNDYVQLPIVAHLNQGTIEFWFNSNVNINQGTNEIALIESDPSGDTNGHFEISFNKADSIAYGNGKIHFYWNGNTNGGASYGAVSTNTNIWTAGEWYHIVCVADGAQWKMYVNGALENSAASNSGLFNNVATYIAVQKSKNRGLYYTGLIDELTIYNRALTADEIKAHYDAATIAPPTVEPVSSPTTNPVVTLSGTKPENTAITVNGTEIYPLDALTAWQGTYTLQSGINVLNITAKDSKGYQSQPVTITVVYDNIPPTIANSVPANNAFINVQPAAVIINLTDTYTEVDLTATINGATVKNASEEEIAGTWTTSGNNTVIFTPAIAFAPGTYTITIYPTDTFGNKGTGQVTFNYDTTAPPAPVINPVVSPTNTSSQTISGTKTAETTSIVITATPSATAGTVTYPTSTTWRVVISGFTQGINTITVVGKDAAGNSSEQATAIIIYDTAAPTVPTVDSVASPTKNSSVTLTGTKQVDTYLYINNIKMSSGFADTSWSYTANINEGSNTFNVYCKDEAGNPSSSVSVTVVRDTTPPRVSSSTPANNAYINQLGTIDIVFTDDNSLLDMQASIAGAVVKNSSGSAVNGTWTVQDTHIIFTPASALADSVYTVTIYPVDVLGNKGTVSFSFTVDTNPPTVQSLTMNPTSPHKAETVTFTIAFNKDMTTTVAPVVSFGINSPYNSYQMAGSWTNAKSWRGTYTFANTTSDGTHTVRVSEAKDKAGNTMAAQDAGTFVLDTAAPDAATINPVTTPTKTPNQALSGTKPANTAIAINNAEKVSLNSSTTWTYTYPLSEGQNNLSITARDSAGNDSTPVTAAITLDTTPPAFTISYKNPSPTKTQILTGTKEPGCVVKLNNTQIFGTDDLNNQWQYSVTLLEGVTSHFVFTASDAMGNTITKTIDILYDISSPSSLAPGVLVADGSGKGTEITLSWAAYVESTDIAYYSIYMSSTNFTDITGMTPISTTNKGTKTYKATGLTKDTTYYFAVVPVDISGNFSSSVNTTTGVPTDTASPEEVTITSVTAGYNSTNGNYITINWNASANSTGDLADQIVYFDNGTGYDTGTPIGKTVTTYTKTGLNDATEYKFKITTKDTLGHESSGAVTKGVTRLDNPTGVTANPGNTKVSLSWPPVSSTYLKQYNIYRLISDTQQTNISSMTLLKTVSASTTAYTDTGLTNGTTYQYAVTTLNTFGAEKTDVLSVSAKPRMDETGPQITSLNLINGQIITAPVTINAAASDAESSMSKLEIYVDGNLAKTQTGASISYLWNVVETTDGNHTIKIIAYDQYGNATEDSRQVVVSLGPPAAPAITAHTVVQTTPEYIVNISGTTPLSTTVVLMVNNTVISQINTATGTFAFSSIKLVEGDNFLSVKAIHRGGESAYSTGYKITVDTGAPSAPANLVAQSLSGGAIRFTWIAGSGEAPSGFNLYMSTSSFTSTTTPGVSKVNTTAITYLLKDYTPPDDSLRYYAVTALDSAGNESAISNVVGAMADRGNPLISSIEYRYTDINGVETAPASIAGIGSVKVLITVTETLKEVPFFSLEPVDGSPVIVTMKKVDDTHYEGTFSVTSMSPHGTTTYKFSGKDMSGNRGSAQGAGITLDVKGPVLAIQSPVTPLQIISTPVEVRGVFDERSVTMPTIELKPLSASGGYSGSSAFVTGLVTSDNGINWTGSIDISGLSEGLAEFTVKDSKDKLGNISTTVSSGKTIRLYKDNVPSPDVPTGLVAKAGKGGLITLTWNSVFYQEATITYNIYRRAENESTPTKIKTGILGSPAQDTVPADGIYYYSVTSVGLLGSESQRSDEISVTADSTGPQSPSNLLLTLDGYGITAVWNAPSGEAPKYYNLYRSDSAILSTAGLTPVAKTNVTKAVDTGPRQSMRFYAVTAADALGNESAPSETKEIVFPVSPVRNMNVEKLDNAAPVVTWQAPADGNVIGYHIYRNGSKLTLYPITALSYTDSYYSGGTVTYGISAVNNLDNESPIKEAILPDISLGLKQGTVLRRGLLETINLIATSKIQNDLNIDTFSTQVGEAPASITQGPFLLSALSTLQVEKVVATASDAPSVAAVLISAAWSPSPGVTVKISTTSTAEVITSGTALEIFNETLVRGANAKIQLKINNIGTSQMEFITSENTKETKKVKVNLRDQDGNLLSTGYLNQRIGSAIVNIGAYSVARLNPNENILTDPIIVPVPLSAPYKVVVEAVIENTYYHYSKPDQVTAPGMTQSIETTISEVAYRANAVPEKTFYATAEPVLITGQAISNIGNLDPPTSVPYVPVKIGVSVKGFDRFATVTTDANGNFSYTFTPGANEAGAYSVWAVHPDINDRTVQSMFTIAGLSISPSSATVRMARNRTLDIPVSLNNYGGASLTGLTFETDSSSGISAGVINTLDNVLDPGEKQSVTLRLSSSPTAPDTGWATMTAKTNEGLQTRLDAAITLWQAIPIIHTTPSYIDTGMVRGNQKIVTFTITNTGEDTLKNARLEGPSTSWMVLAIDKNIGDLKPGESKSVGILLRPSDTLPQAVYDDRIVIYSDNHIPYTYNIQVTVTSNAVGNVLFDVLDELMEDVPSASITFQHQMLTELIYTAKTSADGTAILYDIPEGRYTFNISAVGHTSYSGSFTVYPGITTTVPIALQVTFVEVEWSVVPIVLEDRYEIVITTTFQTNVPAPVLIIEPASVTLPADMQVGQVFNGEFTAKNYGLIALNDIKIQFPTSYEEYDIEVLATMPTKLNAMQKFTVPYRVTKRIPTTASNSLFDEVKGYGGTMCGGSLRIGVSGTYPICPNTAQAREASTGGSHNISIPKSSGASCGGGGCCGGSGGGGGGGGGFGGGGGGQGGGGGSPIVYTPIASETCFAPKCTSKSCECETGECAGSSVIMANGTYEFSETDLKVPAPAIPIEWTRSYRSNRILKYNGNMVFSEPGDGPLGFGWMTPYLARIESASADKPDDTYVDGEGVYTVFQKDSSGNYLVDTDNGLVLRKTASGYEVIEKGGNTSVFNTDGKITSIRDARSNAVTINYDADKKLTSIKDASNRQVLTFTYNAANKIATATDLAGRTVSYEYDTMGNLIQVTDPKTQITKYTYNGNHGVLTKANPLDETYTITYQYSDLGIVSKIIDPIGTELIKQGQQPTGHETLFTYSFANSTFYMKNPLGTTIKKVVNDQGKLLLEEEQTGSETTTLKKIEYLPLGRMEKHTDSVGNVKIIQRDQWRNVISITDGEGNETKITYNSDKRPVAITDALGNITKMEYDSYNNLVKITQAEGKPEQKITTYTYNNYNQMTSAATGGATTTITYNSAGQPETIKDPLGSTTTIQYDAYGNATAIIDANNNKREFTYNIMGSMLTVKDPLGNITTYTYNAANRPTSVKDALNKITNIETDFKGRITTVIDALNNKKQYEYDAKGNLIKQQTLNPNLEILNQTTYTYDSSDRLKIITDPENNTTTYEYAGAGCSSCGGSIDSPTTIKDPLGSITKYIYDKNAKLNSIVDPMGNISVFGRNALGRVITATDANGNVTKYQYDALGRVTKQTDANNGETTFTYDNRGNLLTLTDAKNQTNRFEYDLANRMTKEIRPMNQTIEYTYYANGLLKTVKDAKAQTTTYTYDAANRLTQITYADGKQNTFTYDAVGNMITYSSNGISGTLTYDALNRKLSETVNYGTFSKTYSYSYDALNNKATYTSPESAVYNYTYNKNNQPTKLSTTHNSQLLTLNFDYQWNRLAKATLPNGISTDYQYNANSWLNYITTKQGATTHLDKKYDFDKVGNIDKVTDNASLITDYSYDLTYQLTGAESTSSTEAFTYDKTGNRLIAVLNSSTINYTHNANNEMTSADVTTYLYDANGNTIQETNGTQITKYTYNSSNRLEKVELPDGRIVTYTYDSFGRRTKKDINGQVTYYVYADEGLIGEYNSAGNNIKSYGWVPDSIWGTNPVFMLENNNYYFYHNDHLGTPQKMTDINGSVVWSATYTAFGEATIDATSTITNNLRFAGQYFDEETGKHYNNQRYYNPKTARYIQEDTIGFRAGDTNLFRYVFNSPANIIDPLGLDVDPCKNIPDDRRIPKGCEIKSKMENRVDYECKYVPPTKKFDHFLLPYVRDENVPRILKIQHERQINPEELECIAVCMIVGVQTIAEEKAIEKAAEKFGPKIYYHFVPKGNFKWGSTSKVLVPKLAAEIGLTCTPISAAGKLNAASEAYECSLVCKGWEKRCVKKNSSEKK